MSPVENANVSVFKFPAEQGQSDASMCNVRDGSHHVAVRGKVLLQTSQQLQRMGQVFQEVAGQDDVEALVTESLRQRKSFHVPHDDTRTITLQVRRHSRVSL